MIETDALDRLCLGDHACVVIEDDETRRRSLLTFIRGGLRDGQRILYYGPAEPALTAELAPALADDRLRMATPQESYLAAGRFDPEAMMRGWRDAAAEARADGFRGLRAIGDMSWASRPVPGSERLAWYEANVNRVFAEGDAMAMCLYDRRLFSDVDLRRVTWSHPATLDAGTDPRSVPLLRAIRTTDPPGVILRGEADLSNRHALTAIMENLVADTPSGGEPLVVDISGLTFLDAASVRILTRVAAAEVTRLRVTGCSPAAQRLLAFTGAPAVTNLSVEPAA
ncbi:MEDS domain-containing protein [Actinoplanes sp. DH11]|uniref:MEDS domain-containing protein n=1 Tax=Actinoplanes sp. DH11 TaxID=2857011 RepID=UPI001E29915D|nr:MEDS domain-containing protein [Actinoplanes sp. DH11]